MELSDRRRGDTPCVGPPRVLALAKGGHDGRVPRSLQGDAVGEGGGGGPEVGDDHDGEDDVAGSPCPLEGEDGEVEEADGDLGQGQGDDVTEQREPPCLCAGCKLDCPAYPSRDGRGITSIIGAKLRGTSISHMCLPMPRLTSDPRVSIPSRLAACMVQQVGTNLLRN